MTLQETLEKLTRPGEICEIEPMSLGGVPTRCWKNIPPSMPALIEASRGHGDRDFIVYGDERLSYEQHYRRVAALAHRLIDEYGVRKGDRVAIAMRNYPEWPIAFWASVAVGAIAVPLNAWWTSRELAYGLRDSGAKVAFVDDKRLERIRDIEEDLPLAHIIAARCTTRPEGVADVAACFEGIPQDISLPDINLLPDDDATIFYTSGTTGFPKGTLGTHRNFCSVLGALTFNGARTVLRLGGRVEDLAAMQAIPQAALMTVPLFHVTGCHGIMLTMLVSGGKLVFMYKWDPRVTLDLIESERITMLTGVPAMMWQLLQEPDIDRRDLSSLLSLGYGGAPAPPELLRKIREKAPDCMVANGWGITETSSMICGITGQEYVDNPESVGPPPPACELRVVDTRGNDVPAGEMGELWVRGPNVVKGYWNNPAATAEAFTDGWFHTGDVGRIDGEGFVYILDRLKDMIIRGGENVYCAEVEAALVEHPGVDAACVFGIPHQVLGEEIGAVVVAPDGVDEGELREFAAERLAEFKVPSRIWMRVEPLPLGVTGKVQKKDVREHYLSQL